MSVLTTNHSALWMSPDTMRLIGMSLLHFLWQGAALAALAYLAMATSRRASTRYWIGVAALALMVAAPVLTFAELQNRAASERYALAASTQSQTLHAYTKKSAAIVPASPAPSAPFDLPANALAWLVEAWFAGVILFSMRTIGGVLLIEKLRRRASVPLSKELMATCVALQKRMGIARAIQYCQCARVEAPAVIGWLRPVVLLPITVITGLTDEQMRAVVAHELAHIARLDAFVNLFQIAAETLLFYHPAIWWMNSRIRAEREHCCDDAAIEYCGDAVAYARALALLEEKRNTPALVMAANGSPLMARIRRVLGVAEIGGGMRRIGVAAGILCLSVAVLAGNTFFGFVRGASAAQIRALPQSQQTPQAQPASTAPNANESVVVAPVMVITAPRPKQDANAASEQSEDQESSSSTASTQDSAAQQSSPSGSYIDQMKSAGLDHLSIDDLIALKEQGVSADYIKEMRATGLKVDDVDAVIALKVQGVSPEYIKEMRATGMKLDDVDSLIALKIQGVSPDYIKEMRATGMKCDDADEVIGMKVQGVSPEFVQEMKAQGMKLDTDTAIGMKVQGISPDYLKEMKSLGMKMDSDSLIGMKVQGVSPEYVKEIRALSLDVDADDIIGMKVQGVTPEYIRSFQSEGFKPDVDEIIGMKVQGVTADYVKALQDAGFHPDVDDVIGAKVQGITPEFIVKVKSKGFKDLTLSKLIKLKQSGILD